MWNRQDLKQKGKMAFKRNYGACVLASIILGALTAVSGESKTGGNGASLKDTLQQGVEATGLSMNTLIALVVGIIGVGIIIAFVIDTFVKNPFIVGCKSFFLNNSNENAKVSNILDGFKGNYGKTVVAMFLKGLIECVGTALFVIPGIILAYSYRMVPYILAENPEIEATEVLKMSREMMKGNKWNTFVLDLSFIGWIILSVCTLGIVGVFYTNPYMYATDAELYKAIK